ncbi:MAG: ribulose-phosphate 3-epimerase [candidate division Zixibacteria bacterium]|nr:ribulose-phosphate 3-epimerase [Candidatus Tariuqbacter arcticus]
MPVKIAPSILSADFARLGEEVRTVDEAGADWIHIDVMDGQFVPTITFGPLMVEAVNRSTDLPLDVHLMIVEPERYINQFIEAGADWITVHIEATEKIYRIVEAVHSANRQIGVSLNPDTPVEILRQYLSEIDLVLVMSVYPGFGEQEFIPSALEKIRTLVKMRAEAGAEFLISVDGGVNESNAHSIVQAGADILTAGSSIFKTENPALAVENLRKAVESR